MMTRKRYRDMLQRAEGTSRHNQTAPEISKLTNLNSIQYTVKLKIKQVLDNMYMGKMEIKISRNELENILSQTFKSSVIKQERSEVEQFPTCDENPVPVKKPFISKGTGQNKCIGEPDPNLRTLSLPGPCTFYSSASTGKTVGYVLNELMPVGFKFSESRQEIIDAFQEEIKVKKENIVKIKKEETANIKQEQRIKKERSNEQFENQIQSNHQLDSKPDLSQVICPNRLKISEIQSYPQSNSDLFSSLPKYPPSRSYPSNVKRPPKLFLQAKLNKDKIIVLWKLSSGNQQPENIHRYQIICFEHKSVLNNSSVSNSCWNKLGDIMPLALPMACSLEVPPGALVPGRKYFLAIRAVDMQNQKGDFSDPVCIIWCATK